ncbi:MAG: oxidoreductase [Planctomycetaceae bacterium]|jgi:predicted dehydrogenase|nr:oxidoreductase [Planctomycetaceae bacterium]MDP7278042.1 Gfo/Idh/MocA family oxidoreductase [Planctomycetaceae bacterium]
MLRLGIIDFDSSHCVEFTKRINQVGVPADQWVEGARVVAGWPGTSEMAPERIGGFTPEMQACGVSMVDSPLELIDQVDAVLVLSLSGTPHLERVRPFLEAGLPAFVDKPMACGQDDAHEMFTLAAGADVPFFSCSAMRFCNEVVEFVQDQSERFGPVHGATSYGPAWRAEGNPGLFHYGIHPVEVLFALMGPGCRTVSTHHTDSTDVVIGTWDDGRLGVVRGGRTGATAYGFVGWCERAVIRQDTSTRFAYHNLCRHIVSTLSGDTPPPVASEVTLEIIAFIESALASENRDGHPVDLPR